jgi:hypothetical protein
VFVALEGVWVIDGLICVSHVMGLCLLNASWAEEEINRWGEGGGGEKAGIATFRAIR